MAKSTVTGAAAGVRLTAKSTVAPAASCTRASATEIDGPATVADTGAARPRPSSVHSAPVSPQVSLRGSVISTASGDAGRTVITQCRFPDEECKRRTAVTRPLVT